MNHILILSFFSLSSIAFAQGNDFSKHDKHSELVSHFHSIENYSEALSHADSMLSYIDFYPFDYYYAFIIAWEAGDGYKTLDYLTKGTKKGLDITSNWSGETLNDFIHSDVGRQFLTLNDSLLQIHYESIDQDYFYMLDSLLVIDQKIRDDSPEMYYNDSLNFEALINFSEERGFPTFPSTGYGCNKAWLLLWHQRGPDYPDSPQWQRIIPLINKEIEDGKLRPDFLLMHDQFVAE